MNYKTFRQELQAIGLDRNEIKEVLYDLSLGHDDDFSIGRYRLIKEGAVYDILKEELSSDTYALGQFNAWFISDILGISIDAVTQFQECGAYEGIGELMLQHIDVVVESYVSYDSFGYHFAGYDGEEHSSEGYYIFRIY